MEPKQTFVVARDLWLRGAGPGKEDTCLLHPETGRSCCLGFVALQTDIAREDISGVGEPRDIAEAIDMDGHLLVEIEKSDDDEECAEASVFNSSLASRAIDINDADTTDAERERRLAEVFAKAGYAIEFVNTVEQMNARLAELQQKRCEERKS